MTTFRRLAPVALMVALAACSESATEPTLDEADLTDDVAQFSADAALLDLETLTAASVTAGEVRGDGTMDRRFPAGAVFTDAAGNVMDAYDPLLTEAVSWSFSRQAELNRDNVTGSISRTRSLTISGLTGEETQRVHDGQGSDARTRVVMSDTEGTRSYDFSSEVTIAGVVHAVDRTTHPWPLSGTITRELEVQVVNGPDGDVQRSRTTVLTFNGTQYATLVVDGETFEVDLAERRGRAADRDRRGGRGG